MKAPKQPKGSSSSIPPDVRKKIIQADKNELLKRKTKRPQ
ncbi:hypothetical protein NCCP133_17430 [Cytobacillus sp. NCCP-133]|nr:hypothetical protein NCCP133_17430 [Cytobacillus sp. NCCP-133]